MALTHGASNARNPVPAKTAGEVDQLHAEAEVGLVGAVPVDGLGPRHAWAPRPGRSPVTASAASRTASDTNAEHVLLVDEGRLDVELGELELPVGPQVLVPQAAGDLVVAVHAGHHQQLLGQLGALGQDVARPVVEPAGHGELAGPLGGGRPQQRRLDLDEPLAVHGRPQGAVDRGPQAQVGLHAGPTQVDEAVLEPDHLVDLDPVVHGERRRLGRRSARVDRAVAELDLARWRARG